MIAFVYGICFYNDVFSWKPVGLELYCDRAIAMASISSLLGQAIP